MDLKIKNYEPCFVFGPGGGSINGPFDSAKKILMRLI